jgi:hypothetical protein
VALKAVGISSVEAAQDPSMLPVASAYHNKFLVNDATLAKVESRQVRAPH